MPDDKTTDTIRVLRVIEYRGPRAAVEKQVENSLHGAKRLPNGVVISAATIGGYPEILDLPIVDQPFGSVSGITFDPRIVEELDSAECQICGDIFTEASEYQSHMQVVHGSD